MPVLSRSFIHDSYACIAGKGTHRAVLRHLEFSRRFRYRCHLDVTAFFASVDIDRLQEVVAHRIRDDRVLSLVATLLETGPPIYKRPDVAAYLQLPAERSERSGLPVGNLTSQHLANVFLDGVDHHIKRVCKVPGYLRYMDDLTLFSDHRAALREAVRSTAAFLEEHRGLQLHDNGRLQSTWETTDYLGYAISRQGIRLSRKTLSKIARKARLRRHKGLPALQRSLISWRGMVL